MSAYSTRVRGCARVACGTSTRSRRGGAWTTTRGVRCWRASNCAGGRGRRTRLRSGFEKTPGPGGISLAGLFETTSSSGSHSKHERELHAQIRTLKRQVEAGLIAAGTLAEVVVEPAIAEVQLEQPGDVEGERRVDVPGELGGGTEPTDVAAQLVGEPIGEAEVHARTDERIDDPMSAGRGDRCRVHAQIQPREPDAAEQVGAQRPPADVSRLGRRQDVEAIELADEALDRSFCLGPDARVRRRSHVDVHRIEDQPEAPLLG